ncbi:hypothetical protein BC828DRAFT_221029 [Blastocladiella britannica]|nr:hypothetical protein BC828DRAFT_221029 [Blastocladiella britannica]
MASRPPSTTPSHVRLLQEEPHSPPSYPFSQLFGKRPPTFPSVHKKMNHYEANLARIVLPSTSSTSAAAASSAPAAMRVTSASQVRSGTAMFPMFPSPSTAFSQLIADSEFVSLFEQQQQQPQVHRPRSTPSIAAFAATTTGTQSAQQQQQHQRRLPGYPVKGANEVVAHRNRTLAAKSASPIWPETGITTPPPPPPPTIFPSLSPYMGMAQSSDPFDSAWDPFRYPAAVLPEAYGPGPLVSGVRAALPYRRTPSLFPGGPSMDSGVAGPAYGSLGTTTAAAPSTQAPPPSCQPSSHQSIAPQSHAAMLAQRYAAMAQRPGALADYSMAAAMYQMGPLSAPTQPGMHATSPAAAVAAEQTVGVRSNVGGAVQPATPPQPPMKLCDNHAIRIRYDADGQSLVPADYARSPVRDPMILGGRLVDMAVCMETYLSDLLPRKEEMGDDDDEDWQPVDITFDILSSRLRTTLDKMERFRGDLVRKSAAEHQSLASAAVAAAAAAAAKRARGSSPVKRLQAARAPRRSVPVIPPNMTMPSSS